jgi:hypothetical protein
VDPLSLALLAGGQAISGIAGGISSYKAAQNQLKAAKQAQGELTSSYNRARGYQTPYQAAGLTGLERLRADEGYDVSVPGQYQTTEQQPTYTAPEFNYEQEPGYQFALQQGQNAALTSAAGRGAGLSGATLKALARYGTGLAQQDYGNAYNRYMQGRQQAHNEYQGDLGQYNLNRAFGANQAQQQYANLAEQAQQRYGRASNLAGIGQQAAGNLSSLASAYGQNLAGLYGQRGNVQAAGTMGVGQAVGNIGTGLAQAGTLYGLAGGGQGGYNSDPYGLNKLPF